MKAFLKNHRGSPRKVRTVSNLVKGKSVEEALLELSFLPKRNALPVASLIRSAIANAHSAGVTEKNLYVKSIRVDKGIVMKRWMPRAMGSAKPIKKKMSHVVVELEERTEAKNAKRKVKKQVTKKKNTLPETATVAKL